MEHDEFDHYKADSFDTEPLFTDEDELKKEITKLKRELRKAEETLKKELSQLNKANQQALRNNEEFNNKIISSLRDQNRELFEKNLELHETSKIFVKGLEHLKKDGIRVTLTHHWTRRGMHGMLINRIAQLVLDGKRIVAVCPTNVNPQGDTMEAIIVTEHIDRAKKSI